jgi:ethanolamine utilization protein EutN
MQLARVLGTVVATRKVADLDGVRMLVVQETNADGSPRPGWIVAADTTQAGEGDAVWITTSREAAVAMPEPFVPVDAAIVGIVDDVHVPSAGGAS